MSDERRWSERNWMTDRDRQDDDDRRLDQRRFAGQDAYTDYGRQSRGVQGYDRGVDDRRASGPYGAGAGGASDNDYFGRGLRRPQADREYRDNDHRDRSAGAWPNYGPTYGYGGESGGAIYQGRDERPFGERAYGGRPYGREEAYRGPGSRGDDDRGFFDRAGDEVSSWFGDRDAERRREMDRDRSGGEHRGRGPSGYRRSDERIREDVNDHLSDDAWLDASEIDVKVSDGEVTLSGTVHDRRDKRRAEDLAERVSGVNHVQNNLRVKTTTGGLQTSGQSQTATHLGSTHTGATSIGASAHPATGSAPSAATASGSVPSMPGVKTKETL